MATYQEPMYLSDVLLTEVARGWTTQSLELKTNVPLSVGTVLFRDNTGTLTATPDDVSQVYAVGVLAENVEPSEQAQPVLCILRGAVVATENLTFPSTASDEQIKAFLGVLNNIGIVTQGEALPTRRVSVATPTNVVTGEGSGEIGD